MLNIYRIIESTKAEGPGNRFCIWLQGCSHHCKGCFAVDTWSFENNILISVDELFCKIKGTANLDGVTILGGEPLDQAKELSALLKKIKSIDLTVILFTGYEYSQIKNDSRFTSVFTNVDVLIDGPYDIEQRDFSRPMVGSKNQNFIFLTNQYTMSDFKKNTIEIRISTYGKIAMNGQGDVSFFKV